MREDWAEVLMSGNKIGYAHLLIAPESHNGQRLARMTLDIVTRLSVSGAAEEQNFRITQWVEPDTLRPIKLEVVLHASDVSTTTTATFGPDRIEGHVVGVDRTRNFSIPLGDGPPLMGDLAFLVARPPAGESAYRFFSFLSLQVKESTLSVAAVGSESGRGRGPAPTSAGGAGLLEYPGAAGAARWRISGMSTAGPVVFWLDDANRLVRVDGPFAITLTAASEARAKEFGINDYVPPIELGIGTRVNRPIPRPSQVTHLVVRVFGIDPGRIPEIPGRQQVTPLTREGTGGGREAKDETSATRIETWSDVISTLVGVAQRPVRSSELEEYLVSTPQLEVDDPAIVAKSREMVGDVTDAATAALRISRGVDQFMRYGAAIDSIRSAAEILGSSRGVCRDYAVLYAALARAAGIPTRLCSGLVYAEGGFYLHAWAESYIGRWAAVDPTRSGGPVDATHITFEIGGAADLWDLDFLKDQISVEIESVQPEE